MLHLQMRRRIGKVAIPLAENMQNLVAVVDFNPKVPHNVWMIHAPEI
jgi:hypothetical protein